MVALKPSPNDTVSAITLANCSPCPISHSTLPARTIGNSPGRMLISMTTGERKARPIKAATNAISMVRPRLNLSIIEALLRAAMTDSPVTAIL